MNINWSEFLSKHYWFGIDRVSLQLTDKIILYVAVGLVVVGIMMILLNLAHKNKLLKPVLKRVSSVFVVIGLVEMLWYLLRTQYVGALGTRFAAGVVALVGLFYLFQPIKYLLVQYLKDLQEYQKQRIKEKYLN